MLDDSRSGPSSAALFFLHYLAYAPDSISFTAGELALMVTAAGFSGIVQGVMIPEITMMIVAQKPE
jgi:hypothetical protein